MWKEKDLKQFVLILALLACALTAQAQGTLQFNARLTGADEVPPNSDPTVATGTFWLTGHSLSFFQVDKPLVQAVPMKTRLAQV